MKTLITPLQVLRLAFGEGEYLPPESVTEADIAAAERRYLVPVIGLTLYEKLLGGACADFRTGYLEAPAALFTRAVLQPRLDVRTGQCGTTVPKSRLCPAGRGHGPPGICGAPCWHRPARCCAAPRSISARTGTNFRNTIPKTTSSTAVRPMEALFKFVSGVAAGIAALFAPIGPLAATTVVFIGVDFLSGVAADGPRPPRGPAVVFRELQGVAHGPQTRPRAHGDLDGVADRQLRAGFHAAEPCAAPYWIHRGVELWSFLENAAQLSDAPLFRWLRRYVHRRIRKEAGDE